MDQGSEEEEEEEVDVEVKRGVNMKELVQVVKDIEGNAPRSRQSLYSARRNVWSTPKEMGWCERDRERDREREREILEDNEAEREVLHKGKQLG